MIDQAPVLRESGFNVMQPLRRSSSCRTAAWALALAQLRFIRAAKDLGFTMREIKELLDLRILPGESCAEARQTLAAKIVDIDRPQRELRRLRRVPQKLEAACDDRSSSGSCPALWALER